MNQDQASQEFQLQYDNGSNLHGIFGAYYMRENVPSHQEAYADDLFALAGMPLSLLRTLDDDLTTTSVAALAHVNWEFVPTWRRSETRRVGKECVRTRSSRRPPSH